jgi:predicted metal-dependent peptidase
MSITQSILNEVKKDAESILKDASMKMRFGSDYIYDDHPIGVPFIAQVAIIPDNKCPSMCVNGKELRYNPEFTDSISVNAVKWIVLHEMMHLLLGHHVRRGERNPKGWNIAGDLAINQLISDYAVKLDVYDELFKELQCLLPRNGNYSHLKMGESADYYYNKLEQEALDDLADERDSDKSDQPDDQGDQGDSGEETGEETGDTGSSGDTDSDQPGDDADSDTGKPSDSKTEDYSNGKSLSEAFDDQLGDHKVIGEVDDTPLLDEEGKDVAEEQYEATATQAVVLMKEHGKGAGYGIAMIEDMITKKATNDWRKLREMITKTTLGGINYKRPHRRRNVKHSFIPANRSRGKTKGVLVVDTSGSMGTHEMDEAFVQMSQLFREWPKAEVTMVQCDAVIHDKGIKDYTYNDLPIRIPREWYGNGGTEMQPGIDWIKERRNEYDWAIFVTDMGFSYDSLTESGVPTFFVGVNASPDITLPQKSFSYIPVVVQ